LKISKSFVPSFSQRPSTTLSSLKTQAVVLNELRHL
jgi:hypothetical protein